MATTFFLVRHASHPLLGRVLTGRMPGVQLDDEGRAQAAALAPRLAALRPTAIHASPLERAQETAAPLADATGLPVVTAEALTDIAFGDWTGRSFAELDLVSQWRDWNERRGSARPPGGETMASVQARIVGHLERARTAEPEGRIVLVSHGDVIKAALLQVLGMSLDGIARLETDPASVSTLVLGDWGGKVVAVNERPA